MYEVGLALREARERQRLTLRQAEETTNIRMEYLRALEEGELEALPGRVYAIGFLRSYAKLLNLEAEPLVNELKAYWKDDRSADVEVTQEQPRTSKKTATLPMARWLGYLLAAALAGLLLYVGFTLPGSKAGPETVIKPAPSTTPGTLEPAPPPVSKPSNPGNNGLPNPNGGSPNPTTTPRVEQVINGVQIGLTASTDKSWVAVYIDGRKDFEGILIPGDKREFKGQERVFLHVGNAAALSVVFNGKDQGALGGAGEVVKREFVKP